MVSLFYFVMAIHCVLMMLPINNTEKVHQKWRQWLFLHLPLKVRLKIAEKIRTRSKADKKGSLRK